jgi:hypothetical protein
MENCLVLGSGRSGTSMLAGTLAKCGYYFGDKLIPPRAANAKGFFESAVINNINEDILSQTPLKPLALKQRGYRWVSIAPLNCKLANNKNIKQRIKKAIKKKPFCLKDPRFCYTLPVWEAALTDSFKIICIYRHPSRTANSIVKECKMQNIKGMTYDKAIHIWNSMYKHVLNYKHDSRWAFFHFDQIVTKSALSELEKFLGTTIDNGFPDQKLQHQFTKLQLTPESRKLYNELNRLSNYH